MRDAHRNTGWVEIIEAVHINTEMVGCDAFAMEWVDAAGFAEKMMRCTRVELVLGQRLGASQQLEAAFVNFDHQGVLAATHRAVASRQFGKICFDLEADGAAVTASCVALQGARSLMGHLRSLSYAGRGLSLTGSINSLPYIFPVLGEK